MICYQKIVGVSNVTLNLGTWYELMNLFIRIEVSRTTWNLSSEAQVLLDFRLISVSHIFIYKSFSALTYITFERILSPLHLYSIS